MAYLQYFGAGFAALGICTVVASIVSPERGSPGTIVIGVVAFLAGIAVFVVAGRRDSSGG